MKILFEKKNNTGGQLSVHYRYTFSSNHYIHTSFWASDPLIDRFNQNLSIKGFEAQKQRPYELLSMLWFDKKVYLEP